jgi:hypothetical protein
MSIMSNSRSLPDSGTIQTGAPEAGTGGGRPPSRSASTQIRSLSTSTQIFKIPDEGDLALQRIILEKISFHIAVFPFLSIPDSTEH